MRYWQVVRHLPGGGHQSIKDYRDKEDAVLERDRLNKDYQTDEYAIIEHGEDS